MSEPKIDLSAAVELAAEASWNRRTTWNRAHGYPEAPMWAELPLEVKTSERIIAARGVAAAFRDIARQAWEVGFMSSHDMERGGSGTGMIAVPDHLRADFLAWNPWAEDAEGIDWDEELKRL
jgi:hypothetical protein